jgi:hypothetical protein
MVWDGKIPDFLALAPGAGFLALALGAGFGPSLGAEFDILDSHSARFSTLADKKTKNPSGSLL